MEDLYEIIRYLFCFRALLLACSWLLIKLCVNNSPSPMLDSSIRECPYLISIHSQRLPDCQLYTTRVIRLSRVCQLLVTLGTGLFLLSLFLGTFLCILGCGAAPLSPPCPQVGTSKNVSMQNDAEGQNHPWLGTNGVELTSGPSKDDFTRN